MYCLVLAVAFILFIVFDVSYFLRVVFVVGYGRLFQKRKKITEPTTIYGYCYTRDIDIALRHKNNARFLRDLDIARFHFYDITGLYSMISKLKTDLYQTATSIRYRRVIPLFTPYRIVSQIKYWDEKSIYLEHRFVTNDDFVRAVILSKQTMVKGDAGDIMKQLGVTEKPQLTPDIDFWIKSMDYSSQKLRAT